MSQDRLATELDLLQSMYPTQITYDAHAGELIYRTAIISNNTNHSHAGPGTLHLRLSPTYLTTTTTTTTTTPTSKLPEVLSANVGKADRRAEMRAFIAERCAGGEEVLDLIIGEFDDLVGNYQGDGHGHGHGHGIEDDVGVVEDGVWDGRATVVVWLHHLLNTNKRKQALAPLSLSSASASLSSSGGKDVVSGITKPGYPGVLVYSGPAGPVREHVDELKALNWQAFQVRYDEDEEWMFGHGKGVVEVEAMKEVVADIEEAKREVFMEAMRMK